MNNDNNSVELFTVLLKDTAKDIDNIYSSPITLNQKIVFYHNQDSINCYTPKIQKDRIKTLYGHKKINVFKFPIVDISILETDSSFVYMVYGVDYCCGVKCTEYIALFNINGQCIYDSEINGSNLLEKTIKDYKIKFEVPLQNKTIIDIWVK
ncbi:MAG: hypothetical protein PHR19_08560 [Bacteroidales bacterium]|nr:hypothetical protein [Bacteroidales bacterium]HHT52931.1 hypothetical protein [Bacteroidales bacterium]